MSVCPCGKLLTTRTHAGVEYLNCPSCGRSDWPAAAARRIKEVEAENAALRRHADKMADLLTTSEELEVVEAYRAEFPAIDAARRETQ